MSAEPDSASVQNITAFFAELNRIYSTDRILTNKAQLAPYESDGLTCFRARPCGVVLPENQQEVIDTVRLCHRFAMPFVARGSGTSLSGGAVPIENGLVIAMNRLNKILDYDAEQRPQISAELIVRKWTMADFPAFTPKTDDKSIARGMQAFVKARCNQCHAIAGHGINIGPDLTETGKRLKGMKLLQQILEPSSEINKKYQTTQFLMNSGKVQSGVVVKETDSEFHIISNLLIPTAITKVTKSQVDERFSSKISAMPEGMADVLTRPEIVDLVSFLETGFNLPEHLKHKHMHHKK